MKVFLTGASGYIGSAVTKELVSHGIEVVGMARSPASEAKVAANGATPVRGDSSDIAGMVAYASEADATIHCAFDHSFTDFAGACATEVAIIDAIGAAYAGTDKVFIASGGALTGIGIPGFDETMSGLGGPRLASEVAMRKWGGQGVRTVVIRLPPLTHGEGLSAHSFIGQIIDADRKAGFVATVDRGAARWPSGNIVDVAVLYRLALDAPEGYTVYHATDEDGIPHADIAQVISDQTGLPIKDISAAEAPAHFGFIGAIIPMDACVSSKLTRERLGWTPKGARLLDELKAGRYFDLA